MLNYKGYACKITYDYEARIFHGKVIGTQDVITFKGKSVDEIETTFHTAYEAMLST